MIFNKGDIYRFGVAVREYGERMAHKKVLGIPVLRWCCGPVIKLGLAIKNSVRKSPIKELCKDGASE